MAKFTNHQKIQSVLYNRVYMTPESICEMVYLKFGDIWKTSNTERRLREMAAKGLAESKAFKNKQNSATHKRWRNTEVISNG